ncbi:MAG: hypothetical protein LBJ41_02115 [Treponema sp.]|jgi:hypothetical protein|nr:hypothetical protein [Treponema sp.]
MAQRSDWVPGREGKLVELIKQWIVIVGDTAIQALCEWLEADCKTVTDVINVFLNARITYENVNSTTNRIKKDEAKAACVAAIRVFANENVRFNRKVTDDLKERLGITIHHAASTSGKTADAGPASEVLNDNKRPGVVVIRYLGAKPEGSIVCNISFGRFKPGEDLPRTVDALVQSDSFTHNPWEYTFPQDASGDKFFYALRWVMSGGAKSNWSAITGCIIP